LDLIETAGARASAVFFGWQEDWLVAGAAGITANSEQIAGSGRRSNAEDAEKRNPGTQAKACATWRERGI